MTIKQLRELSGMTQLQFSLYFGIPLQTVKQWESSGKQSERTPKEYMVDLMAYKLKKEGIIKDDSI